MCRYAFHSYKPHLACFGCRKVFRRRLRADVDPDGEETLARCPECGGLLADLGLDFKAPPARAVKRWRELASLWRAGITFHSCGCGGAGMVPSGSAALAAYLRRQRDGAAALLAHWRDAPAPTGDDAAARRHDANRQRAIRSLATQVARLDAELARGA